MSIVYTWKVSPNGLLTKSQDGKDDVVTRVIYSVEAVQGEHRAVINDSVDLSFDPNGQFIAFADLTEGTVINWVKAAAPEKVALFERSLAAMIDRKINPPIRPVAKAAPWNTCIQA